MADNRKFWETKTFIGCALIAVGIIAQFVGVQGVAERLMSLAGDLGVPTTIYGIADRFRK